jgi:hypothetical protein
LAASDRQYSKEFAIAGAKVGNSINVRLPNRYYVSRQTALQMQDTQEIMIPVKLTTPYQVGLVFTAQDLLLSLDDFSKRIITPAMASMASAIDYDGFSMFKSVFNMVGNPGSTPGVAGGVAGSFTDSSSPNIYLNAGVLLNYMAVPKDNNRWVMYDPLAEARSAAGFAGLFNPSKDISHMFLEGDIQRAQGFNFAMGQNINRLACGNRAGTPVTYGSQAASGSVVSTLATSGWTANTVINAGEVIKIGTANSSQVNFVNPETQQDTGIQAMFVVQQTTQASSTGLMNIPIYPSIQVASVPQGANATYNTATGTVWPTDLTNQISNNLTITLSSGSANTSYPQHLAFHKDWSTFATADYLMPGGVDFAARETYEGVSMLITRQYDINNLNYPCRLDVLAGWNVLRPELAVRITG